MTDAPRIRTVAMSRSDHQSSGPGDPRSMSRVVIAAVRVWKRWVEVVKNPASSRWVASAQPSTPPATSSASPSSASNEPNTRKTTRHGFIDRPTPE